MNILRSISHGAALAAVVAAATLVALSAAAPLPARAAQSLQQNGGTEIDRVIAIVNEDVITKRERDERVQLVANRLRQTHSPVPPLDVLQLQVLDQMVLERIQLQKAKEDGIVVSDADVQKTLERLASLNRMSLDVYRQRLAQEGVAWSMFTEDARNEMVLSKLREKEVDSRITVSDAEVANYLASQRGPGGTQNDLHLQQILIRVPDGASDAEIDAARAKAQQVLKQALAGDDFGRLAKNDSQSADAAQGGDLGFASPDKLPDAYVKAASELRPGQVDGDLIRTGDGFHIVKLVARRPSQGTAGDTPKMVQTHVRHILVRIGNGISEAQARDELLDVKRQIDAGGDFAAFARSYSQDGSASQGGDLGWISPGETVPEFERAMSRLQDGQVSEPVRTEYGYHLIQVLGRRDADLSVEQQQRIARQAVGQRKAEQAYSDWLRQLRDSAYVQYKFDTAAQ